MSWLYLIFILILILSNAYLAYAAMYWYKRDYRTSKEFEEFKKIRYFSAIRTVVKAHPETNTTEMKFQMGVYKFEGTGYYSVEPDPKYDFKSSQ